MFNRTTAANGKPNSLPGKPQTDEKNKKISQARESAELALPVKSNVHQLFWGSYLWRQEGVPKVPVVSYMDDINREGKENECANNRL